MFRKGDFQKGATLHIFVIACNFPWFVLRLDIRRSSTEFESLLGQLPQKKSRSWWKNGLIVGKKYSFYFDLWFGPIGSPFWFVFCVWENGTPSFEGKYLGVWEKEWGFHSDFKYYRSNAGRGRAHDKVSFLQVQTDHDMKTAGYEATL